ncbi:uncharacterized protein LOC110843869 isoform X2 [Folsomia candida]|uniref:uncharacterized protein LOC110843869 isoform X2 n=1 Tax=Folsomia candida TaxID=158441 RepID=UPI000B8F4DE0|nr:uncharacterized protein LOC110843869 isoform X2 [Folsomia candida]
MATRGARFLPFLAFVLLVVDIGVVVDGAIGRSNTNTGYSPSNSKGGNSSPSSSSSSLRGLDKVLNRLDAGGPQQQSKDYYPFSSADSSATLFSNNKQSRTTSTSTHRPASFLDKEFDDLEEDELDDDDSYEDEDDTDQGNNNDVHADKLSHWAHQYRNRYLASKTTTSTTTTTTTTTPPPPPAISYSQYKWNTYGTRTGVEQSRRQSYHTNGGFNTHQTGRHHHGHHHNGNGHHNNPYGSRSHAQPQTPGSTIKQAVEHALKVQTEGACRHPRPKLIRVQEFYPHPGKTYLPHCTILHQCSDDTGCCKNDLTCSPKTTQRVELSFYTITVESNRGSTVERLVFYNHTECECRDKQDEMMPRDFPYPESPSKSLMNNHLDNVGGGQSTGSERGGSQYESSSVKNKNLLRCKCPSGFAERILGEGACSCDCFDRQTDCLRQKRGRNFFSMQDKWCIQSGRCEIPVCSYGSYIHLAGRCPRKREKYSLSWHRYLTE